MRCLTKYQIQALIDNELNPVEKTAAEQHLAGCPSCRDVFEEQKFFSEFLKKELVSTVSAPTETPAFRVPRNNHTTGSKKPVSFWLKAAAVLLPAILVWQFYHVEYSFSQGLEPRTMIISKVNMVAGDTIYYVR